ncbi:Peptidylprolyl isomerase [Tenacibaculum sp. 190130A14a]|uniref:Peptidyl-prolyl cis-trans isomerase n=1 Tax=Tenacibaculum polynesiense TaxID=3137857 RepID=A0ABM9PBL8_9FLAO
MIKFRHILLVAIIGTVLYACGSDSGTTITNFDHAGQAVKDNDSLVKFLKNHYYDAVKDSVKLIDSGQTSLFDDSKLVTKDVSFNDVDYKLYYYVNREGTPNPVKGNPTKMDSILVTYGGKLISNATTIGNTFDSNKHIWFTLAGVIEGWRQGFVEFKGGENVTTTGGPLTFANDGKGILFMPSGLAYRNLGSGGGVPANANLIFYFNLHDIVEDTDHDNDLVPSIYEDPDQDGDPRNDDTDGDRVANYLDSDDDGDGKLTKDEDTNKDGDPRNDDTDGDGVPNYLDRDTR